MTPTSAPAIEAGAGLSGVRPAVVRRTHPEVRRAGRARRDDGEARPAADARRHFDPVLEQRRQAAHDREAEAHARVHAVAARVADLVELLEDPRMVFRRDADARVDDVDRDVGPA